MAVITCSTTWKLARIQMSGDVGQDWIVSPGLPDDMYVETVEVVEKQRLLDVQRELDDANARIEDLLEALRWFNAQDGAS